MQEEEERNEGDKLGKERNKARRILVYEQSFAESPTLSTMTRPSWVALHGMAHSFTELDKAVVHMIRLVSFLWLWFSVCLPSDGEG